MICTQNMVMPRVGEYLSVDWVNTMIKLDVARIAIKMIIIRKKIISIVVEIRLGSLWTIVSRLI